MVTIPSGWSPMGDDEGRTNERPQREVYLDTFQIDRFEVTNLQYSGFVGDGHAAAPVYWIDGQLPAATPWGVFDTSGQEPAR